MAENVLYYGDNLDILRRYVKDETVDLVYLDPPFNSAQTYNVLFAEHDGSHSAAQIKAFEDTWAWNIESEAAFRDVVIAGGKPSQAMQAFRTLLGENDMLAYLAMMAPRLMELRRVLKPTGSIYLHCDPTASHYLKVLMDAILGLRATELKSFGCVPAIMLTRPVDMQISAIPSSTMQRPLNSLSTGSTCLTPRSIYARSIVSLTPMADDIA